MVNQIINTLDKENCRVKETEPKHYKLLSLLILYVKLFIILLLYSQTSKIFVNLYKHTRVYTMFYCLSIIVCY